MTKSTNLTLVSMAAALAMAAAACDTASSDDDSNDTGGSAGSAGSGKGGTSGSATGGTGATDPTGTVLQPAADGWMDRLDVWNDAGIQGSWYPYGDQYGDGPDDSKCTVLGMHMPSECSTITSPAPPPATGFPNTAGSMCTTGSVAQVLPCVGMLTDRCPNCSGCPDFDYSTMWGAGIGFDINADKGEDGGMKHVWDPATAMNGPYIGIEFTIDAPPLPGLRVEIPMLLTDAEAAMFNLPPGTTTDSHPDGAAYWGAMESGTYPNSPVMAGVNRVLWTDIQPPKRGNYTFDPARMLGVQFHVPANTMSRGDYTFCISNVKLLRQ
jgi:hypothetical protein